MPTYGKVAKDKTHIIDKITKQTQVFNIIKKKDFNKLPYGYMSLKVTKEFADVRFIAGSFKTAMQPISKLINTLLNAIKPLVRKLWESLFTSNNMEPQWMWLIESSIDVKERLENFNRSMEFKMGNPMENSYTYDVKTLYTRLPHLDIAKRMAKFWITLKIW